MLLHVQVVSNFALERPRAQLARSSKVVLGRPRFASVGHSTVSGAFPYFAPVTYDTPAGDRVEAKVRKSFRMAGCYMLGEQAFSRSFETAVLTPDRIINNIRNDDE